jgi:hypothetical protein
MVIKVWRLKVSKSEVTDDVILIFEMTMQLTICRETFDVKYSSKCARHNKRFDAGELD